MAAEEAAPKLKRVDSDAEDSADDSHVHPFLDKIKGEESSSTTNRIWSIFKNAFGGGYSSANHNHNNNSPTVIKVHTMTPQFQEVASSSTAIVHIHSSDATVGTIESLTEAHDTTGGALGFVKRLSAKIGPQSLEDKIEKERIHIFHPFDEAERQIEEQRGKIFHHEGNEMHDGSGRKSFDPYHAGAKEDAEEARKFPGCDKCCGGNGPNTPCVIL